MAPPVPIELRQVRDVGDVLNDTFRFLRQNARPLGKSLLFIAGPAILLSSVSGSVMQLLTLGFDGLGGAGMASLGLSFMAVAFFGLLASALACLVVNSFVVLYQDRGPGTVDVADVWQAARARFWKVLGAVLLSGLILGAPIVIVIIPCLGFLAYLALVAYFGVVLSLVFPMLLREDIGVVDAVGRARALARDYWWPSLAVLLVSFIVYGVLALVFSMPAYVLTFVYGLHAADGGGVDAGLGLALLVASMVGSLGSILLYSIPLTAVAFQYFNLVERKERKGLLNRIEALEGQAGLGAPGPGSPPEGR